MRIAYINADPSLPAFGKSGGAIHIQEIIRAMLKRGADVHLFTSQTNGVQPADLASLNLHSFPWPPRNDSVAVAEKNATMRSWLEQFHLSQPFDLIYERQSLWSFAAMEFAREHRIPGVLEVNAPLIQEMGQYALINRSTAENAVMRSFRSATAITAVSKQLAHLLEEHPSARGKIHIVPNGVNPDRFSQISPALQQAQNEFIIGFLGTLKPWNGLTILLEAFAQLLPQLPISRLLIVGDGPDREYLDRELANRRLSESVDFTGPVLPTEVPKLLASMDVAVAPYPPLANFYFSPIKLFEYMAAGLPVVASDIGQVGDILEHGVTGVLVPAGDASAVADAIYTLAEDSATRASIGWAAREYVLANHTWDAMVDRIFALAVMKTDKGMPTALT